jgi:hypothetical protein
MIVARYKPGDCVRARASALLVPAGALGTVVPGYPTTRDAFEVRFDGWANPILMWEDQLELVARPADDTPQP